MNTIPKSDEANSWKKHYSVIIRNLSVKDMIFGVTVWISVALIMTILFELIKGWSGIANMTLALGESLAIIGLVAFFCVYSRAKGKMNGILNGVATKRKTRRIGINGIKKKSQNTESNLRNQRHQCCNVLTVAEITISSK